jgi:hypothetical protein
MNVDFDSYWHRTKNGNVQIATCLKTAPPKNDPSEKVNGTLFMLKMIAAGIGEALLM